MTGEISTRAEKRRERHARMQAETEALRERLGPLAGKSVSFPGMDAPVAFAAAKEPTDDCLGWIYVGDQQLCISRAHLNLLGTGRRNVALYQWTFTHTGASNYPTTTEIKIDGVTVAMCSWEQWRSGIECIAGIEDGGVGALEIDKPEADFTGMRGSGMDMAKFADDPVGSYSSAEAKIWEETRATRERFGAGRSMGWPNLSPSVFFVAPERYEEGHSGRLYVGEEFVELDAGPLRVIDANLTEPGRGASWLDWNFNVGQDPAVPVVEIRTPKGMFVSLTNDQWLDGLNFLAKAQVDQVIARGQRMTGLEDDAAAFRAELARSGLAFEEQHGNPEEEPEPPEGWDAASRKQIRERLNELDPDRQTKTKEYATREVEFKAPGWITAHRGHDGRYYLCELTLGAETLRLTQGEWDHLCLAVETIRQDTSLEPRDAHAVPIGRWAFGFHQYTQSVVFSSEHQVGHMSYEDWLILLGDLAKGLPEKYAAEVEEPEVPAEEQPKPSADLVL